MLSSRTKVFSNDLRALAAILAVVVLFSSTAVPSNAQPSWPLGRFAINSYTGSGIGVGIDYTTFIDLTYAGQEPTNVYDARVGFTTIDAYIFHATYEDGFSTQFTINPEFGFEQAQAEAQRYAPILGRLPNFLRRDVDSVTLHDALAPGAGGGGNITLHTQSTEPSIKSFSMEELTAHEAAHSDLSEDHWDAPGWRAAQQADGGFLTQYAANNPDREDVTVSITAWLQVRHRPERVSQDFIDWVEGAIPNRLTYFDSLNLDVYPLNRPIAEPFVDSTSSLVTHSPNAEWSAYEVPGSYFDHVNVSKVEGATATLRFTGTQATVYGMTRNDLGIANIYINGEATATIDTYSNDTKPFQPLFQTPVLPPGDHTLTIEVTGDYNPAATASDGEIILDAFQYTAIIPPDTTPPSPNGAAWASSPALTRNTSIGMTATPGADINGPIEYYFAEVTGNPGGTDSGWQASPFYTDDGLSPGTEYAYTVQLRDSFQNTGVASIAAGTTTLEDTGNANFFAEAYSGSRNNFTGWVGYDFTPTENLLVDALGRVISESLEDDHEVKIWRVRGQQEIASVLITPTSATDYLGVAFEALGESVELEAGVTYRIASSETSGGDSWRDVGPLPSHAEVARIDSGVFGNDTGSFPAGMFGGAGSGYAPPTFFFVETLRADFNQDGRVDAADYTIWRDNNGTTDNDPWSLGDADGDGDTDGTDYLLWRQQYGRSLVGPSPVPTTQEAVPEPSTLLITWVAIAAITTQRNQPQSR